MEELLRKRLPDDVVQYFIYINSSIGDDDHECQLTDYLHKCLALVAKETVDHVWQNESFNLQLAKSNQVSCLRGSTNFGDCIDDEWLIVYLIQKITQIFPDLIASIADNDGQFLLIESAEFLPKWLTPDCSENRVFFSRGILHVILKPETPADIAILPMGNPTLSDALNVVSKYPLKAQASSDVIAAIEKRTSCFPTKLRENLQFVNVFVPRKIVYLLHHNSQLISKCVQAFYLRDPIDLRTCRTFEHFPPSDRVWTQVKMTRCHYAQLMQQHFVPDKRSGYQVDKDLSASESKGYDLGMKIAHGFEIICSNSAKRVDSTTDLTVDENKFSKFIVALSSNGYFENEIKDSKHYKELHKQARHYYANSVEADSNDSVVAVLSLLKQLDCEETSLSEQTLEVKQHVKELPVESTDGWLYVGQEDVDQIAKEMQKGFEKMHTQHQSNRRTEPDQEDLHAAVGKLHEFVDNVSDYSGVEVKEPNSVKFEADKFMSSLETMLGINFQSTPNLDLSSDEDSDEFLSSEDDNDHESPLEGDPLTSLNDYISSMDRELAKTEIGKSFTKQTIESDNVDNDVTAVDIDVNLVENVLKGSHAEHVTSGPFTNIFGSIGVNLPEMDSST